MTSYFVTEHNPSWTDGKQSFPWPMMMMTSSYDHHGDVMESRITSQSCVCSTGLLRLTTRKHQRSASLSLGEGIHWWPAFPPHKDFLFYDIIMNASPHPHPLPPLPTNSGPHPLKCIQILKVWVKDGLWWTNWALIFVFRTRATHAYNDNTHSQN